MIPAVVFIDIVGLVAILAICGGMLFLASRIEPHWVAKDKRRFLTTAHELDQFGLPMGRKHEVRVHVDPDTDSLVIRRRSLVRGGGSGRWYVHAKSPKPPRGRAVYILKSVSDTTDVTRMALRFPAKSAMIPHMDELLAATGEDAERRKRQAVNADKPTGEPSYYPTDVETTETTGTTEAS